MLFFRRGHDTGRIYMISLSTWTWSRKLLSQWDPDPGVPSSDWHLAALNQGQKERLREEIFAATSLNLSEQIRRQCNPRLSKSRNHCSPSTVFALDTITNMMPKSGRKSKWRGFRGRIGLLGEEWQQHLKYLLQRPGRFPGRAIYVFPKMWRHKPNFVNMNIPWTWMRHPLQWCSHPCTLACGRMRHMLCSSYTEFNHCWGAQHSYPKIPPRKIYDLLVLCLVTQK